VRAKSSLRLMTGTVASFTRSRTAAIRSLSLRAAGLIAAAALSGILAPLLVLAASALAFVYEQAKSRGKQRDG
jgi:hypothetical protein